MQFQKSVNILFVILYCTFAFSKFPIFPKFSKSSQFHLKYNTLLIRFSIIHLRIYTPGSDINLQLVEKLMNVLFTSTNPSKVFLLNNARVLMSLDKKELATTFDHHYLQRIVNFFTTSSKFLACFDHHHRS